MQLETSERENFDISEYLRHELSVKDQRLTALHNTLDEVTGQPARIHAMIQRFPRPSSAHGSDKSTCLNVTAGPSSDKGHHARWMKRLEGQHSHVQETHTLREDFAAQAHRSLL